MERRSSKQSEYSKVSSKEVIERRTACNDATRNSINVMERKTDQFEKPNRISSSESHLPEDDEAEDGLVASGEGILRKGGKKGQALKLNVNVQEDGFFEEPKLEVAEKPVITFNHVCTVAESEQISFETIRKAGSRSPSPLLEVPAFKIGSKQAVRPPL